MFVCDGHGRLQLIVVLYVGTQTILQKTLLSNLSANNRKKEQPTVCVCVCVFCVWGRERKRDRLAFVRGHMHRCLNTGATAYSWPIYPQPPHAASTCERAHVMYNVRPYMSKFVRCFGVAFLWNQSSGELLLWIIVKATGFGPFNLPTCAPLPGRRDRSHSGAW